MDGHSLNFATRCRYSRNKQASMASLNVLPERNDIAKRRIFGIFRFGNFWKVPDCVLSCIFIQKS